MENMSSKPIKPVKPIKPIRSNKSEVAELTEKELLGQEIKRLILENKRLSCELDIATGILEETGLAPVLELESESELVPDSNNAHKNSGPLLSENAVHRVYKDIILEFCPDVVFFLRKDGKFAFCSKALFRETGMQDFNRIETRNYKDVLPEVLDNESCAKLMAAIDESSKTGEPVFLTDYFDFGQKELPRYCAVEITPIEIGAGAQKNTGIAPGIFVMFDDLTEFAAENKRAEIADKAKSDFLSTMSHEIRTPMNAILGMTEILSRTLLDAKQKKYVENIKSSSNALLAIINDILDFSKIEEGKADIQKDHYNPHELFDSLYEVFVPVFKNKNLEFYFSVSKNIPDSIYGDAKRLSQVIKNILSNALKYTPEGHVEFFAWICEDGILHVDIHDTGIGIRPEDLKKLFLPFEQLDTRKHRNIVGTGLGLAISRRLCELMNGKMSVESTYGAGTTFSIEIPCMAHADQPKPEVDEKLAEFSAKSAKVLVVDDIDINLSVAEAMLQIFDITPDLTLRGQEAVEMAAKKQYDLIFMDHMMPEMDGVETMKQIRLLSPAHENMPIVALTANVINHAEQMFLNNGFNGFLPKPIEINALNLCLRKFLPSSIIENAKAEG